MDSSPVMALLTPQPIDEISVADSFIMGVLRGWRLLQAAGLNAEEKRDILGSTKNSFLDYEVISSALQTLWDEQLLGHRSPLPHQGYSMVQSEHEAQYHDETWDNDAEWWNYETYYVHDDDDWWGEAWDYSEPTPATVAAASTEEAADDPQLREAQQAEKIAESLALDAQRTWTEARRATQALRKDRGFGAVASTTTGNGLRCFICGGPHLARDCPDRRHPSNWKGKGKHKGMMLDYDYYENYYTSKGLRGFPKGKSKGKGKKGSYMEAQAQWLKGKGKGQSHGHPFRSVNAYGAMELNLGGLEVSDAMDLTSSTTATSSRPELGMLDSGATASAAPEAVIQGLISSILEQDRSAKIEVDPTSRPYFRFGDGRWGRALYRTRLSSDVSGVERQFSLFALPNPPAFYQPGFDKSTLVPILVGMDFLGHKGSGMVIDFTTGLAMSTFDDTPDIYPLKSNPKGHFLLDICYHLTRGLSRQDGHVHVKTKPSSNSSGSNHEVHVLDLHAAQYDMTVCDSVLDEADLRQSRDRLLRLHQASQHLRAAAPTGSMRGPCGPPAIPTTSSSTSLRDGNSFATASSGSHGPHLCGQPQGEGQILDHGRTQPGDPRDPRAATNMWPCFGQHVPSNPQSNNYES